MCDAITRLFYVFAELSHAIHGGLGHHLSGDLASVGIEESNDRFAGGKPCFEGTQVRIKELDGIGRGGNQRFVFIFQFGKPKQLDSLPTGLAIAGRVQERIRHGPVRNTIHLGYVLDFLSFYRAMTSA